MNKTIIISIVVFFITQSSMRASENPQQGVQLPHQALHIEDRVDHEPARQPRNNNALSYRPCLKTCLCCVACVGTVAAVPIGFIMVHLSKTLTPEFSK